MNLTRRGFLKLLGAAAAAAGVGIAGIPAMDKRRDPYVVAGESVSHIGPAPGGFIGSKVVHEVQAWDGVGYPVLLHSGIYGGGRALERYYDFDLADFQREVPDRFWHSQQNWDRYPNVHTYVREQRFGESVLEAMRKLNFRGVKPPPGAIA